MPNQPTWRKPGGRCSLHVDDACVEVATDYGDQRDVVAVRNSTDPDGTVVVFTRAEWSAFIADAASFAA
ncbi:DUF397 domain-containing protein [Rugosimonospora africana]|uniref:DUF397 domain-containing protein n=1 Tax=Rugosimonospora africana TaxID=556532 RepID=A0A8J3R4D6_9ACTN|nr:DUF397 domain-containing protein [Rugosimonospora africana]GIH21257.1 hypothetical protein Raf01_94290 [Rugosimonospora africana]